ncbi:MAG: hypothetical protein M3Z35_00190 [Nitrospirota bacterium]|nr:hypothetical protein [Nitrospirota bacterium]
MFSRENIHIPDGFIRTSYNDYRAWYDACIRQAGGIDIQVLGIGQEGHRALTVPASILQFHPHVPDL